MNDSARISAVVFAGVAFGILLLAITTTVAIGRGAPEHLRLPFRLICHGIEARCPSIGGVAMPICFRCTGIYAGMLLGIGFGMSSIRLSFAPFPGWAAWVTGAPLIIDGTTQLFGLRESTNELRAVTGLVAGVGFLLWAITNIGLASKPSSDLPAGTLERKSQPKD